MQRVRRFLMPKWNASTLNMLRYALSGTTRCTLVLLTLLEGAGKNDSQERRLPFPLAFLERMVG
jgi:hypothetical protein